MVNKEGSVRQIALAMNLKKTTLQRHVKKYEKFPDDGKKDVSAVPCYNTKQVFTTEPELSLKNYLITSAKMHFSLTRITFAKFAYSFAVVISITVPDSSGKKNSARASIDCIFSSNALNIWIRFSIIFKNMWNTAVGIKNCKQLFSLRLAFTTKKAIHTAEMMSVLCVAIFGVINASSGENVVYSFRYRLGPGQVGRYRCFTSS